MEFYIDIDSYNSCLAMDIIQWLDRWLNDHPRFWHRTEEQERQGVERYLVAKTLYHQYLNKIDSYAVRSELDDVWRTVIAKF